MKYLIPLLLCAAPLLAETVTVKEAAILKADRTMISVKAGTEVELIARDADTATIRYHNVTGKIPAYKLEGGTPDAGTPKAEEKKIAADKPAAPPAPLPVRPPQTTYGKAVQKTRDTAGAHDKNAVKPGDEILKPKE